MSLQSDRQVIACRRSRDPGQLLLLLCRPVCNPNLNGDPWLSVCSGPP